MTPHATDGSPTSLESQQVRFGQPALVRWLARVLLGAYFRRIDRFHPERAPETGPVLFVANHPGSLTDALLIGVSVDRPVNFVATVRLFRSKPVAWLLSRCGVIPINRKQDDPAKMASVAHTFAACFAVLRAGGAVGLFPEGISYDDSRLKDVKTGAARLALGLESEHGGKLGLRIVPVGLTYSAKERFRSRVLVNFGEPMRAADFIDGYDEHPRTCVHALRDAIEARIRALILDTPDLEHDRILNAVRRLYLERLRSANLIVTEPMPDEAETLLLMQAIADALRHFEEREPERLAAFVSDLDRYEHWMDRLGLSDRTVDAFSRALRLWPRLITAALLVLIAPFAIFGWLHHVVPAALVGWSLRRFTPAENRKSQTPITVMIAGALALIVCYTAYIGIVYARFGTWPAIIYAGLLPVSGLVALYWLRALRQFGGRLRSAALLLQRPVARRTLVALRAELIDALDGFRADYTRDVRLHVPAPGP